MFQRNWPSIHWIVIEFQLIALRGLTYGVSTSLKKKKKKHIELCLKWRTVLQIHISYNIAILKIQYIFFLEEKIQYFVIHLNENRLKHRLDCILEVDKHHLSLIFFFFILNFSQCKFVIWKVKFNSFWVMSSCVTYLI